MFSRGDWRFPIKLIVPDINIQLVGLAGSGRRSSLFQITEKFIVDVKERIARVEGEAANVEAETKKVADRHAAMIWAFGNQFDFHSTLAIYREGRAKAEKDCATVSAEIEEVCKKREAIRLVESFLF